MDVNPYIIHDIIYNILDYFIEIYNSILYKKIMVTYPYTFAMSCYATLEEN